jgi:two-component system, sensor histidine kinase and response regulator
MDSIIKELLLLAEVRKTGIELQPLHMGSIVQEARCRLANVIDSTHAEFLPAVISEWPVARGYAPWVEEVWANYLSNAMKYGGQPPRLELGAIALQDGMVRFWVRDNGRGIPPEQCARLFTPFTRLDPDRAAGHGLGLSTVRRIVEKLGGQVAVESVAGEGSVFSFTLPAAEANGPQAVPLP